MIDMESFLFEKLVLDDFGSLLVKVRKPILGLHTREFPFYTILLQKCKIKRSTNPRRYNFKGAFSLLTQTSSYHQIQNFRLLNRRTSIPFSLCTTYLSLKYIISLIYCWNDHFLHSWYILYLMYV